MDGSKALIFIIKIFIAVVLISRIINFILGTYYMETRAESEIWTFVISFIIDSIAMYGLVKFGYGEGWAEALNLVFLKSFFFVLFYLLALVSIECIVVETTNLVNFFF